MFIPNKYTKWYLNIINNSRNRIIKKPFEKHHIIPKSLGGSNKKENITRLTPREHFICHRLLVKMTDGLFKQKMSYALYSMCRNNPNQSRFFNSIQYEKARQVYSQSVKGKTYEELYGIEKGKKLREQRRQDRLGRKMTNNQKEKMKKHWIKGGIHSAKKWLVTDPYGNQFEIINMAKFCRENNLSNGNMTAHGKTKGYTCVKLS